MMKKGIKFEKLLLVDDDDITLFYNEAVVSEAGLASSIDVERNGIDALKRIQTYPKDLGVIVLLDLNMPRMSGLEFLAEFDEFLTEDKENVKVFMLTTSCLKSEVEEAMSYDFVIGFLEKPLSIHRLIELINDKIINSSSY